MEELQLAIKDMVEQRALFDTVTAGYLVVKRIFDFIASFSVLLLLLPVFVVVAAAIKIESRGPVFFSQERTGFKGKLFKMYKFRSMVTDAEKILKQMEHRNEINGHMFKIKNDPRVTKVGRFIRKTSIDELPQLFNVLKGEMSIVGPRPPIIREVVKYDAWQNLRLSVKPGMTGLWQISGRNSIDFYGMVRLDLKYIRERGFTYDLKIILRTIPLLLGDKMAS